jgi:hypothetical protein
MLTIKATVVQYALEATRKTQDMRLRPGLPWLLYAVIVLCVLPGARVVQGQPVAGGQNVTVGAFTVTVPDAWVAFSSSDASRLRRQYIEQSNEIYRRYSGSGDPAKTVDVAAFHIDGADGTFALISFTVPPRADLIPLLQSQAPEKAAWGIKNGYIKKYVGLTPINDNQLSGFYIIAIGNHGEQQVTGGVEHKNLKNTIVQLTLLCPTGWDDQKAVSVLSALLKSVVLK